MPLFGQKTGFRAEHGIPDFGCLFFGQKTGFRARMNEIKSGDSVLWFEGIDDKSGFGDFGDWSRDDGDALLYLHGLLCIFVKHLQDGFTKYKAISRKMMAMRCYLSSRVTCN